MISNPPYFKGGRCRWPAAITRCRSAGSMKRWHRPRVGANEKVVKGFKAATMHLGVRWVRPAMRNVSSSASRHRAGFARTAATRKCRPAQCERHGQSLRKCCHCVAGGHTYPGNLRSIDPASCEKIQRSSIFLLHAVEASAASQIPSIVGQQIVKNKMLADTSTDGLL